MDHFFPGVGVSGNAFGCNTKDEIRDACEISEYYINADNETFNIYPNPVTEKLHLKLNKNYFNVSICNLFGNIVYAEKGLIDYAEIDFSNFSSGMYFVEMKIENRKYIFKCIKL